MGKTNPTTVVETTPKNSQKPEMRAFAVEYVVDSADDTSIVFVEGPVDDWDAAARFVADGSLDHDGIRRIVEVEVEAVAVEDDAEVPLP